jgi:hypothetical protein
MVRRFPNLTSVPPQPFGELCVGVTGFTENFVVAPMAASIGYLPGQ